MKKTGKQFIVYLALSVFAWLFNAIYQLFAHGVKSVYMANMWMVLAGGALFYLMLNQLPAIRHRRFYRLFTNVLNTSAAVLVVGMLLRGIIDIAGSASVYIVWYFTVAKFGLILAAILFLLMLIIPVKKVTKTKKIPQ